MSLTITKKVTEYYVREFKEVKVWKDNLYDGRCVLPFSDYVFEKKEVERKIKRSKYLELQRKGELVFAKSVSVEYSVDELIKELSKEFDNLCASNSLSLVKNSKGKAKELMKLYKLKLNHEQKELQSIDKTMYSEKFFSMKDDLINDLNTKINDLKTYLDNVDSRIIELTVLKDIKKLEKEKKELALKRDIFLEKINAEIEEVDSKLDKLYKEK